MAIKIELKRSAVPGKIPTTSSLELGELAINTYDGKVFLKQDNGVQRIIEIAGGGSGSVASASYADRAGYATTAGYTNNAGNAINAISASYVAIANYANTSDYANTAGNADTATNALNADNAISASYALTASYVENAQTASYVLQAVSASYALTASYVENAQTASYVLQAVSASYALTASYTENTLSASYSLTASYVENIQISGSINNVDYINFNTSSAYQLDVGRLGWDSGEETLQLGLGGGTVTYSLGEQLYQNCFNAEATTLTKGQVVYISGSQGNTIAIKLAKNNSDSFSAGTLGLVAETITSGGTGWVITEGPLRKLDTTGLIAGGLVFLGDTPGTYTQTPVMAPSHSVRLGYVQRVHDTVGSIYVKIDNGYELGELHDVVDSSTTSSYGDLLIKSGSVWVNSKQLTGSYGITGSLDITGSLSVTAGVINSLTSSYAISSSYALTSSHAMTASYVANASSFPYTGSALITGSLGVTGSFSTTGDAVINGQTVGKGSGNIATNTVLGLQNLSNNTTGNNNTALGTNALFTNSVGGYNTATGVGALYRNTSGNSNVANGWYALFNNSVGNYNVAIGQQALTSNTSGSYNTTVGYLSLQANTTGINNIAIGYSSLYLSLIASSNVAVGYESQRNNQIGTGNVSLGNAALLANTSGSYNVAVGEGALYASLTGSNNVGVGRQAGRFISAGTANSNVANSIFIGNDSRAAADGQTNQIVIGNSAIGFGSNTTVLGNTSTTRTHIYGNLSVGTTVSPTSFILIGASTSTNGSIRLTPGVTYTGTDSGTTWYETTNTRLRFLKGTIASDIVTTYDNFIYKGTGTRMMSVNSMGDISATDIIDQGFVTDTDVITAITGSTYTLDRATIVPANSKVFYQGQMYDSGSYTYLALDDNYVRRW